MLFFDIRLSSLVQDKIYHSPSSRESPEKIYASPSEKWYSESTLRKSLLPAIVKKINEEMEALSSHSSDPECNGQMRLGVVRELSTRSEKRDGQAPAQGH